MCRPCSGTYKPRRKTLWFPVASFCLFRAAFMGFKVPMTTRRFSIVSGMLMVGVLVLLLPPAVSAHCAPPHRHYRDMIYFLSPCQYHPSVSCAPSDVQLLCKETKPVRKASRLHPKWSSEVQGDNER
jgi:hypothetical protein